MKTKNLTPYECYHNFPVGTKFKCVKSINFKSALGKIYTSTNTARTRSTHLVDELDTMRWSCWSSTYDCDLFDVYTEKKRVFK